MAPVEYATFVLNLAARWLNDNHAHDPNQIMISPAWTVSALCRPIADSLDGQFNPVTVRG
jgi:hypothetical protein